tara:strand:- start:22 stop:408 length:387 start_codon:yes stop_codon:yes gene_type:complete
MKKASETKALTHVRALDLLRGLMAGILFFAACSKIGYTNYSSLFGISWFGFEAGWFIASTEFIVAIILLVTRPKVAWIVGFTFSWILLGFATMFLLSNQDCGCFGPDSNVHHALVVDAFLVPHYSPRA